MSKELFLSHLSLIERLIRSICRRSCLMGADAEDFESWVKLKLIDDDYGVLRKFRGKAKLTTYLTTVLHHLARDYCIQRTGRWRPSAAARRLGAVAVQLETLLSRDGRSLDEAVEILKLNHRVEASRKDLVQMASQLTLRPPRRFTGEEAVGQLAADVATDQRLVDRERSETLHRTETALARVLGNLGSDDRLILKMRFEDGFTVARIASTLGLEPRPLYSRIEKCLRRMRGFLEAEGLQRQDVARILGWEEAALQVDYGVKGGESATLRPSHPWDGREELG